MNPPYLWLLHFKSKSKWEKNSLCNYVTCTVVSGPIVQEQERDKSDLYIIFHKRRRRKRFILAVLAGQEVITLYLKQLWRTKWGHEMLGNRLIRPLDGKATSCSKSFVEKTTSLTQTTVVKCMKRANKFQSSWKLSLQWECFKVKWSIS